MAGKLLEPYSHARLVGVMAAVCGAAYVLALCALSGVEGPAAPTADAAEPAPPPFRQALVQVWAEADARRFTVFIFVSMLAYSAQDLILEPFAGTVFAYTPRQTTQLSGLQHGGVLAGRVGPGWPLAANVFLLGAANGAFSIAAIGSMMRPGRCGGQRPGALADRLARCGLCLRLRARSAAVPGGRKTGHLHRPPYGRCAAATESTRVAPAAGRGPGQREVMYEHD